MQHVRGRLVVTVACFRGLLLFTLVTAPLLGTTSISLARAFDRSIPFADNVDAQVFFVARLPRVLAAAVVGSSLAMAGVIFQALLGNPLAAPDTLGVSMGATVGAMIAIVFHLNIDMLGLTSVPVASFIGSLGALAMVYLLAVARGRGTSTTVLLLAGVALTALLGAAVRFIQMLADYTDTFYSVRWMMGSLDVASYAPIGAAGVPVAIAFGMAATLPRVLDLLSLGSDAAAARGVDVTRAERIALVSASLATGAAVSLAGPVAFVGIVVPHMVRLVVGADHRLVLPGATLFGATFLVVCDLIARSAFRSVEMPVGVVTAAIGGPLFLWLLFRRLA